LDPSKIDSEERAPNQISSELHSEQTTDAKKDQKAAKLIAGRSVANEVCGKHFFYNVILFIGINFHNSIC
jgi:hypothetical protein